MRNTLGFIEKRQARGAWHTSGFTTAAACPRWGHHFTAYSLRLARDGERDRDHVDTVRLEAQKSSENGHRKPKSGPYWSYSAVPIPPAWVLMDCVVGFTRFGPKHLCEDFKPSEVKLLNGRPRWGRTSGFTTILRARGAAHLGIHHSRRVPQVGASR